MAGTGTTIGSHCNSFGQQCNRLASWPADCLLLKFGASKARVVGICQVAPYYLQNMASLPSCCPADLQARADHAISLLQQVATLSWPFQSLSLSLSYAPLMISLENPSVRRRQEKSGAASTVALALCRVMSGCGTSSRVNNSRTRAQTDPSIEGH